MTHLSVELFLLIDSVVGWPVYAGLLWFTYWYPLSVLRRDGYVLP